MSTTAGSSSCGSGGSEEVEVSGRGRGIRVIDLPAVFTTSEEREMLSVITAFDLSRNELQELTNLQPLRSLLRLNASYNHIFHVEGLPLRLTQLNLAHNKLEHLDHISQLTHLRELDISFNRLTSLAGLSPRVPLEVLKAEDNRIQRTVGLEGLQTLRVLSLSNNYIEDLDELLFLPTLPALQLLSLTGNPVTRARRYRRTAGQLQSALVSLDGTPVIREDDVRETSALSSAAADFLLSQGRKRDGLRMDRPVSTAVATASAQLRKNIARGDTSTSLGDPAQLSAPRHSRDLSTSHRTAATQTVLDSPLAESLDASSEAPRAEAPRPATRAHAATTTTTNATSSPPAGAAAATSFTSTVAQDVVRPQESPARGAPALAVSPRNTPQRATPAKARAIASPTFARARGRQSSAPPSQQLHQRQAPPQQHEDARRATTGDVMRPLRQAAASASPRPPSTSWSTIKDAEHKSFNSPPIAANKGSTEVEGDAVEASAATVLSNVDVTEHGAVSATPSSSQRAAPWVGSASGHSGGGNGSGYASLYATPAAQQTLRSQAATIHTGSHIEPNSGSAGRLGRLSSQSPATLQRSVASQELDMTTAQLHDSLVAQEQLRKECQALRQRVKHMEGQVGEARRVISKQLAELSQLRVERDALRQSEADVLERLEKEKRVAKARVGHHAEEIRTLQSQYERMKTFCEAQLADTRRELSAERARLLHQQQRQQQSTGDAGEAGERAAPVSKAQLGGARGTVARKASLSDQHSSSPVIAAASSVSESATQADASHPLLMPADSANVEIARQLTSWLYASMNSAANASTAAAAAAPAAVVAPAETLAVKSEGPSGVTAHEQAGCRREAFEGHPTPPPPPLSIQQPADTDVSGATDTATAAEVSAARRILEDFVIQHSGRVATARSTPLAAAAGVAAAGGSAVTAARAVLKPLPAASSSIEVPSTSPSQTALSTATVDGREAGQSGQSVTQRSPASIDGAQSEEREHNVTDESVCEIASGDAQVHDATLPLPLPPLMPLRRLPPPPTPPPPQTSSIVARGTEEHGEHDDRSVDAQEEAHHLDAVRDEDVGANIEEEEEEESEGDTIVLSAPPTFTAVAPAQTTTTAALSKTSPSSPVGPVDAATRDQRVQTAKALLKGMEGMFEDAA